MNINYYTVGEVAKQLNLSDLTIRRYIKSKKIQAYKIGREYRIDTSNLQNFIYTLKEQSLFYNPVKEIRETKFKFIDLFAGIGGFHIAFKNLGGQCVFASEINESARLTYMANFYEDEKELFESGNFNQDITKQDPKLIPDFDILCAGFPCQPFSNAGFKKGFGDTRGTLFFDIAKIIKEKQPKAIFLENVRGLFNHDNGKTFEVIKKVVTEDLGYSFYYKVIKADNYGVPQHRPRLFMVGFKNELKPFKWPDPTPLKKTMSDILGGECKKNVGYTLRVGGRGSGVNDRRNWDCYIVDGVEVRLNPKQGLEMQGFPKGFIMPVSETQAMKQLGNSVAVPAIQATAKQILSSLDLI